MTIFSIPDSLANQYQSPGYALAAIGGEQVVRLVFLPPLSPDADLTSLHGYGNDPRIGTALCELDGLGEVAMGFCSGRTFLPTWRQLAWFFVPWDKTHT